MDGLVRDVLATVVTFAVALAWLKLMEFLAARGKISSVTARKWIHIGTGPLFVLCWNLFSDASRARWLAALVPAVITLRFALIGLGVIQDPDTVRSMSRTGNPRELLRGPLMYGVIFVLSTLVFWGENPLGIMALMLLCAGDGFADLVGRRWGQVKLPWNGGKSWAGSAAFFLSSLVFTGAFVALFHARGWFDVSARAYLPTVLAVSAGATLVESLPIAEWDNVTVFLTALLLGYLVG